MFEKFLLFLTVLFLNSTVFGVTDFPTKNCPNENNKNYLKEAYKNLEEKKEFDCKKVDEILNSDCKYDDLKDEIEKLNNYLAVCYEESIYTYCSCK